MFALYEPVDSPAAVLARCHAVIIDELLDAVVEVERLRLSRIEGQFNKAFMVACKRRRKAVRAYVFIHDVLV